MVSGEPVSIPIEPATCGDGFPFQTSIAKGAGMIRSGKITLALIVVVGLCAGGVVDREAEAFQAFTLGVKYWYPEWKLDGYSNFPTIEWDTTYGMIGPTMSLHFSEHFAISASFFSGKFEKEFDDVYLDGNPSSMVWKSTRSDADLAFIWMAGPYVSIFGGFKYLAYDQKIDGRFDAGGTWEQEYDLTAYGAGTGLGLNIPFGQSPFALYCTATASYLAGTFDFASPGYATASADVSYPIYSGEAGLRIGSADFPLVLMISYRYQKSHIGLTFDQNVAFSDSLDETFAGPIVFLGIRL
jgi:hypothetical protein